MSYVLIVQSDNVFDLLLNFTAVMFICELDEIGFKLAKSEYFGERLKREADVVDSTSYYYKGNENRKNRSVPYHALLIVIILAVMYICFFGVAVQQTSLERMTYMPKG